MLSWRRFKDSVWLKWNYCILYTGILLLIPVQQLQWNVAPNSQHTTLILTLIDLHSFQEWDSLVHQSKSLSSASFPADYGHSPLTALLSGFFDLLQDAFGVEEGHLVTDVVHHHKSICPVHRLLQDTSAASTVTQQRWLWRSNTAHNLSGWCDYRNSEKL